MTTSQVEWIGRYAAPENALHEFIKKLFFHAYPNVWRQDEIMGATAWWNIRPSNPKPHNDRISISFNIGLEEKNMSMES
jgi:hypothetical protein